MTGYRTRQSITGGPVYFEFDPEFIAGAVDAQTMPELG